MSIIVLLALLLAAAVASAIIVRWALSRKAPPQGFNVEIGAA